MCIVKIVCVLIKILSQKNKIQWSYSSLDEKKKTKLEKMNYWWFVKREEEKQ